MDRQGEGGAGRVGHHPAFLREEHRADIEGGTGGEPGDAVHREFLDFSCREHGGETQGMGGGDHPFAMQVEIGGHAFEGARTVEHDGRQPHAMAHGTDDARIAFEPLAFEKG